MQHPRGKYKNCAVLFDTHGMELNNSSTSNHRSIGKTVICRTLRPLGCEDIPFAPAKSCSSPGTFVWSCYESSHQAYDFL